jgi:LPXTG-motif cell wall-anchored protein
MFNSDMKYLFPLLVGLILILSPAINCKDTGIFDLEAPDQELFDATLEILLSAQVELESKFGIKMIDTVHVRLLENRNDFDTATFGGAPDWGVGVAIQSKNLIVILVPFSEKFNISFHEVLRHELAHMALFVRTGGRRVPRFMHEGFAMTFAHQWSFDDDLLLAKAKYTGSLFSLKQIESVNMLNSAQARLAYAQSFQAVKYIIETFGYNTFQELLNGFSQGLNRDMVFQQVLGTNFDGFDKMFAQYISKRYHWIMIFTDPTLLWIGLALIVIIGFLLVRKRRSDTYKKWEEEEKYESTDFDYEEPSPWD